MKSKVLLFAAGIVFSTVAIAATVVENAPKVLFKEDFSRFQPGTNSGLTGKDEIVVENGMKFQRALKYSWMLGKLHTFGAAKWEDIDFNCDFRFENPKGMNFIIIIREFGKREPGKKFNYMSMGVGSRGVNLSVNGLAGDNKNISEKYKNPLKDGVWYKLNCRITYNHLKMTITDKASGASEIVFDHDTVPGYGGVNICAFQHPFSIANVVISAIK